MTYLLWKTNGLCKSANTSSTCSKQPAKHFIYFLHSAVAVNQTLRFSLFKIFVFVLFEISQTTNLIFRVCYTRDVYNAVYKFYRVTVCFVSFPEKKRKHRTDTYMCLYLDCNVYICQQLFVTVGYGKRINTICKNLHTCTSRKYKENIGCLSSRTTSCVCVWFSIHVGG